MSTGRRSLKRAALLSVAAGVAAAMVWAVETDRTGGCPECRELAAGSEEPFQDPAHEASCASCHHPHGDRAPEDWRFVCYDCHAQAWTRTVAHRVPAEVFARCSNCHVPHTWTAEASDCISCHGDLLTSEGLIPFAAFAPQAAFSHERHAHLECAQCHDSSQSHAELTVASRDQCMDCHHGSTVGVDCAACHGSGSSLGPAMVRASMVVAGSSMRRTLRFDHARHQSLDCARCHGASFQVETECRSCHEDHHRPDATCVACHAQPREGAHTLAVHRDFTCAGSGCHAGGPGVSNPAPRNVCQSCHQDQLAHYPESDCSSCHKLTPDGAEAGP